MTRPNPVPRSIKILRWTARIWSILVAAFFVMIFVDPLAGGPGPIASVDIFILSLTGVALLGLLIAWRWEFVGGAFALVMLFVREIVWVILKGQWLLGFLILWIFIAPPAVLFLAAWSREKKAREMSPAPGSVL